MDPTDLDNFRQALSAQGILVGQHEQALRGIMEKLQDLTSNISELNHHLQQRPAQSSMSATSVHDPSEHATPPPFQPLHMSSPREPHMPVPERYCGDLGACGRFLLQCSLVFDLQPSTYNSDKSRIAFILGLLTGRAAQWATALWENNSPICQSYNVFSQEMRRVFDHPVKGKEASKRLLSLSQGHSPVAQYAVDFRILAAESGWDDEALQAAFLRGLAENIKDELAARDESNSLEELISLAIRLDNRLRERLREN